MNTVLDNLTQSQIISLARDFRKTEPFNYLVIDNFLSNEDAMALAEEFPSFEDDVWFNYENPLEIKKASNNWNAFKPATYKYFQKVLSNEFVNKLSSILDTNLTGDIGLHGGGFHTHKSGGKLNPHLDYSIHPKLGLQRRANLILYINPNWKPEYGGAFGVWEHDNETKRPGKLSKTIDCVFNRAVIFDTTQNSWHGIANEINAEGNTRNSLAVYYLAIPKENADPRMKVKYAPTEEQKGNADIEDLIEKRQSMSTFSSVYKTK
jgi:Rps23 Pro-64 3,4-dihydroxylase Tpa1-like proline 4-hydroxylase